MIGIEVTSVDCRILLSGEESPYINGHLTALPVPHDRMFIHLYAFLRDMDHEQDADKVFKLKQTLDATYTDETEPEKTEAMACVIARLFEDLPEDIRPQFLAAILYNETN